MERALERQREEGVYLDQIFLKMHLVSKEDLLKAMSEAYGVAYIDLALVDEFEEYAQLLPEIMCRRYKMVCVSKVEKTLVLVMANLLDVFALDDVRLRAGYETRPLLGLSTDIEDALNKVFGRKTMYDIISEMEIGSKAKPIEKSEEEIVIDAPLIRLVDGIIIEAVKMKASDIHIEAFENESDSMGYCRR